MTNAEFETWLETHFVSRHAAAAYLELSRDTVDALVTGKTRKGFDYAVPHHIALACMAVARGLAIVPKSYASGVAVPAPGRKMAAQTAMILARADGTRTVQQIAAEMKINRKAVYAAIAAARKAGAAISVAADPALPAHLARK